jgi:SAM-dependent methyltransferase
MRPIFHRLRNLLRDSSFGIYKKEGTTLSADFSGIDDEAFRVRYINLTDIIQSWVGDRLSWKTSDVLDFGCGEGITALGVARRFNPRSVRAVDIMPDPLQCLPRAKQVLGLEVLPDNLSLMQIEPGEQFAEPGSFDLIYSWSVFEHVEQPIIASVLQQINKMLRPGGYFLIQIAPLYYSSEGSHLFHRIAEPWGHLQNQDSVYFDKLCRACESKEEVDALWSCYQWLNRLTVAELKRHLSETGFTIVREYTTEDPNASRLPPMLLDIFKKETLLVNQVVMLYRA